MEAVLPAPLKKFAGEILDMDSHEMMPAQAWVGQFGEIATAVAETWMNSGESALQNPNHPHVPGFIKDDQPVDPETIWRTKGCASPGAVDPARRLDVMDAMGVRSQLMFPTGLGMFGVMLCVLPADNRMGFLTGFTENRYETGRAWIRAYNEWGIRASNISPRLRPVLPLIANSVAELMEIATDLIERGARAFWLPSALPPGGVSPAHFDLDPFWDLLAKSNVVPCLHVGSEGEFFQTTEWGEAQPFSNFRTVGEFRLDPWWMGIIHLPSQNFLQVMAVGGVFERHPDLTLAVAEVGCHWIGPMLQNLDMWHENNKGFATEKSIKLPQKPSYYVRRCVRSSPFDFEPVAKYIEAYREYGIEDILCFASDYPHVEGGKDPVSKLYGNIEHLGPDVVEKFFVKNAKLILS